MPKLPLMSGKELQKIMEKAGFQFKRHTKHIIMYKPGVGIISIPVHMELDRGTLRGIRKDARLTVEEFEELLAK